MPTGVAEIFANRSRDDDFRLETSRLLLRWPNVRDAHAITSYASKFEVSRWTSAIPHPYPAGAAQQFIMRARVGNAAGAMLQLVATLLRSRREVIGGVGLDLRAGKLTLSYVFSPEVWGIGYATESAEALVEAAFTMTDVGSLHSGVFIDNERSRRVLAKVGFKFDGFVEEYSEARGAPQKTAHLKMDRQDWLARRSSKEAG